MIGAPPATMFRVARGVRRSPRRRAFTLLEVILVIGVLVILLGLTLPDFSGALTAEQLPESGARCKALLSMCRAQAMNESRRYRVWIRPDGSIKALRQLDPLEAPHDYIPISDDWGREQVLLDDVWVDAVQPLSDGPPPLLVDDDEIEFSEIEEEPLSIATFDEGVTVEIAPDGTSNSLKFVLRDLTGRGLELTLDGRLGRITLTPLEAISASTVQRPAALPSEAEADAEALAREREMRESKQ